MVTRLSRKRQERRRRRVDPLEVLDRHDHRAGDPAELGEQGRDRVQDAQPPGLVQGAGAHVAGLARCGARPRVEEGGQDRRPCQGRRDLGVDVGARPDAAQEVGHRQVGQARVAQVDTLGAEHQRPPVERGGLAQRPDQTGLPDPGVAGDQHRAGCAVRGGGEGGPQDGQLLLATHQGRRTGPGHDCMMAAPPSGGQGIGSSLSLTGVPVCACESSANAWRTVLA